MGDSGPSGGVGTGGKARHTRPDRRRRRRTGNGIAASHSPTISVDRPFLYLIRDSGAGTILFIGRVTDPTLGARDDPTSSLRPIVGAVQVPSIDDLQRVFGQRPVSVAEVSLGEVLPLDRWPDGEVVLTAEVAGRAAHVHLHPNADRLGIQIDVSSPVVVLSLDRVQRVDALLSDHVRGLSFITRTADGERSWILRTHPDIELRSE